MNRFVVIGLILFNYAAAAQADTKKILLEADKYYKNQQFAQAAIEYAKVAAAEPENEKAKYNEANALYRQDKKLDAVQQYAVIAANSKDPVMLAKSWYNKGVILTDQKNLEESIEAYKHALRNDPNDKEARENLQKALLELKSKKQENKKQQQDQQKKKEKPQQNKSKMQPKEADQRLRLLQQKEQEVQERVQKEKTKIGGGQKKDW
jgi:Ca-activated chloride channel homolog